MTYNYWPDAGLYIGAQGEIVDLVYNWYNNNDMLPVCILVKFDKYVGPSLYLGDISYPGVVPIPLQKVQFTYKGTLCTRQNIGLSLCWAVTIDEIKEKNVVRSRIDIGDNEISSEVLYSALSCFEDVNHFPTSIA